MRLVITAATCLFVVTVHGSEVVTYTAPESERQESPYQVWADDQAVDVYAARTLDPPFAGKQWDFGGPYSFASFDMSGRVVVKITSSRSLRGTVVRPVSADVVPKLLDDHSLTITLDQPRKLSIEPDGTKGPLLLFANEIEKNVPTPSDTNVIYFGPGIHKPERINLGDNQTLYLAGGSVVKAEVAIRGTNVRIRGRGILDGSDWAWRTGPVGNLIAIRNSSNVEISGITLRGSSHWSIVPAHSRHVTLRNVKLCNSRVQNDDGINPCNSQDVLITDCFIRSDDDCIALKGLNYQRNGSNNVERITVENSTLWCDRARIFLLGHESRAEFMRDVTFRNLDIVHFSMTPFLLEPGEDMKLQNVRIENIRIHGEGQQSLVRLKPVVNQYMHKKVPGLVKNIRFENVKVTGSQGEYLVQLEGADAEHNVSDITFHNVQILETPLTKKAPHVRIGPHVKAVRFSGQ